MKTNPYHRILRTHQVNISKYGKILSTRVTGDLRIIWKRDEEIKSLLLILEIGGYSGSKKVYK